MAIAAMILVSCGKSDYQKFIGTWGVERIEYFNVDFQGDPILASADTFYYDPDSTDNGIQLVFREDKTGEMRDSAIDSIAIYDEDTQMIDHYIYNPDTVIVTHFTYSYDKNDQTLYMNMVENARTYRLQIQDLSKDAFIYENEYIVDYLERAYLKRVSDSPVKSASRQKPLHPHKIGSLLGDK